MPPAGFTRGEVVFEWETTRNLAASKRKVFQKENIPERGWPMSDDITVNLSQQENGLAGADLAAVATNFSQAQLANQSTRSATAKVLGLPGLLDYLK
jgi:hypothetical protein